jgi:hypothetical protein
MPRTPCARAVYLAVLYNGARRSGGDIDHRPTGGSYFAILECHIGGINCDHAENIEAVYDHAGSVDDKFARRSKGHASGNTSALRTSETSRHGLIAFIACTK